MYFLDLEKPPGALNVLTSKTLGARKCSGVGLRGVAETLDQRYLMTHKQLPKTNIFGNDIIDDDTNMHRQWRRQDFRFEGNIFMTHKILVCSGVRGAAAHRRSRKLKFSTFFLRK
jgi:hypothetical protein